MDNIAPRGLSPCRILCRDAAATKHTTRRSEQHRIRATRRLPHSRCRDNTTREGLAASPLDSTSHVALKRTLCTGASPHPPHSSTPRIHFRSRRRNGEQRCPTHRGHNQTAKPSPQFRLRLVALPLHLATAAIVASQGSRLRCLPMLYDNRWPQPS